MIAPAPKLDRRRVNYPMPKVLILGGTADAVGIAQSASEIEGLEVTYSLAGVTRTPRLPGCEVRTGGFGGAEGMAIYLRETATEIVVDATHPFATQISEHAADACHTANIPHLQYRRPAWTPGTEDNWIATPDIDAAAAQIESLNGRTFLTIGLKELAAFSRLRTIWFLVRSIETPPDELPLPRHELTLGRGPFSLDDELSLIQKHQIAVLVSRNSGGLPRPAKLDAARDLGLPVVIIDQPPTIGMVVSDLDTVMERLRELS